MFSNCCDVACKISIKADTLFVWTQKQLLVSDINTMISSLNYFNWKVQRIWKADEGPPQLLNCRLNSTSMTLFLLSHSHTRHKACPSLFAVRAALGSFTVTARLLILFAQNDRWVPWAVCATWDAPPQLPGIRFTLQKCFRATPKEDNMALLSLQII